VRERVGVRASKANALIYLVFLILSFSLGERRDGLIQTFV